MSVRKCSVVPIQDVIEFGEWKCFAIAIPWRDFKQHASLHQYRARRYDFRSYGCTRKWLSNIACLITFQQVEGLTLAGSNTAFFTAKHLRNLPVLVWVLKYKTICSRTTPHVNDWCSYHGIVPCISSEQPLHFLAQTHAWNAFQQAPHSSNNECCTKSLRRMINQASEVLLFTKLNRTLYFLNAAFIHTHS